MFCGFYFPSQPERKKLPPPTPYPRWKKDDGYQAGHYQIVCCDGRDRKKEKANRDCVLDCTIS